MSMLFGEQRQGQSLYYPFLSDRSELSELQEMIE
jgi:hypothetical protein